MGLSRALHRAGCQPCVRTSRQGADVLPLTHRRWKRSAHDREHHRHPRRRSRTGLSGLSPVARRPTLTTKHTGSLSRSTPGAYRDVPVRPSRWTSTWSAVEQPGRRRCAGGGAAHRRAGPTGEPQTAPGSRGCANTSHGARTENRGGRLPLSQAEATAAPHRPNTTVPAVTRTSACQSGVPRNTRLRLHGRPTAHAGNHAGRDRWRPQPTRPLGPGLQQEGQGVPLRRRETQRHSTSRDRLPKPPAPRSLLSLNPPIG